MNAPVSTATLKIKIKIPNTMSNAARWKITRRIPIADSSRVGSTARPMRTERRRMVGVSQAPRT